MDPPGSPHGRCEATWDGAASLPPLQRPEDSCGGSSGSSTVARVCYGVAPSPAPGASIIGFGAARHFGNGEPLDGAELCGHLELADIRLSQHARRDVRCRRARQGEVDESLILEGKLRCLDLLVR